ncbi:MAG: UPF0158 family protein [bacterium]|nr:UPF0158 family protein [bacterium]
MKKQEIKPFTEDELRRIADELDSGFQCFWNITNNDLVFIPDPDRFPDDDHEIEKVWKDDLTKVKKNKKNIVVIECLDSHQSFEIMSDFVESLETGNVLAPLLRAALRENKPFNKFKFVIDNSGDYREKWFSFKTQWLKDYVKGQAELMTGGEIG